ncbi:hypothetical protein [Crenobacter cavernae]|uniref:Uncharacterized protein n=1 Tax=Crenobacter cavernae TaxID=2290923 RepID=A0ABY0FEJ9_9NEIS|nr:hypothetical protein [Crenobacter cavernae]RXZ44476.1 hypothetical protein EBB06_05065 [Crenobacter cavernae]
MPTVPFLSRQRGASTLLVSLILVASTGMAAAYAHQQTQRHSQSTTSNYRYQQAFANAELGLAEAKKRLVDGRRVTETAPFKLKDGENVLNWPVKDGEYTTSLEVVDPSDPVEQAAGRTQYRLVSDGSFQGAQARVALLLTLRTVCLNNGVEVACGNQAQPPAEPPPGPSYGFGPPIQVGGTIHTKRLSGTGLTDLNVRGDMLLFTGSFYANGTQQRATTYGDDGDDGRNDRDTFGPHQRMTRAEGEVLRELDSQQFPGTLIALNDAVHNGNIFECGNNQPAETDATAYAHWQQHTLKGWIHTVWKAAKDAGHGIPPYLVIWGDLELGQDGKEYGDCEIGWPDPIPVAPVKDQNGNVVETPRFPKLVVTGGFRTDASLTLRNMSLAILGDIEVVGYRDSAANGRTGTQQSVLQVLQGNSGRSTDSGPTPSTPPQVISRVDPTTLMNSKYWADL